MCRCHSDPQWNDVLCLSPFRQLFEFPVDSIGKSLHLRMIVVIITTRETVTCGETGSDTRSDSPEQRSEQDWFPGKGLPRWRARSHVTDDFAGVVVHLIELAGLCDKSLRPMRKRWCVRRIVLRPLFVLRVELPLWTRLFRLRAHVDTVFRALQMAVR